MALEKILCKVLPKILSKIVGFVQSFVTSAANTFAETCNGILLEGAATNLMLYSSDSDQYDLVNAGTGILPVVTKNYDTAPDGSQTTTRVVLDLDGGATSAVSEKRA